MYARRLCRGTQFGIIGVVWLTAPARTAVIGSGVDRSEQNACRRSYGRMPGAPTAAASGPKIWRRQFAQS